MADGNTIDQNDIEKLLSAKSGQIGQSPSESINPVPHPSAPSENAAVSVGKPQNSAINQNDIEKLLAARGNNVNQPSEKSISIPSVQPAVSSLDNSTGVSPPLTDQNIESPKDDSGNTALVQNDIENLLKSSIGASATQPRSQPKVGAGIGMPKGTEDEGIDEGVPQGDIDYLLRRAEEALESITTGGASLSGMTPEVIEFQFPEFGGSTPNSDHATLDQISEVELDIKIELGRTNMYLEDILKLRKGSVVALDKIAGDAVDIYVNERLIARGEVLVLNDNFCVRVAELLAGAIPIE